MCKCSPRMMLAVCLLLPLAAQADAVSELLAGYERAGARNFNAAAGEALWRQRFSDAKSGQERGCSDCHTDDLRQTGKHARTGKRIEPMAPSVNPERFTDSAKIEKWFLRNCKWTLGRTCTPQEKGDLLTFLKGQ
jgi:hypothetical protein